MNDLIKIDTQIITHGGIDMNYLIEIENNKELGPVVSSRTVANELGKKHTHVLESLNSLILENRNVGSLIIESSYKVDGQNREYKEYLLTKDGFTLYMFNIQGHNDFKMAYINRFNEMERVIKQNQIQIPSSPMEALELMFEEQKNTKQEVEEIKSEVIELKENAKLDPGEYGYIGKRVQEKVTETIRKFSYANSNSVRSKLLKNLNGDIKRITNVSTRSQLKQKDFEPVIDFINTWEPSSATQYQLRQIEAEEVI